MIATVLITGANRGIGLEFARQYAHEGWRVYAACRNPQNAHELNEIAAASHGRLTLHPLDVTNADRIRALAAVLDEPVDILLNNAGTDGQRGARFGNTDEQSWLATFAVNVIGSMKMMEAFVEHVARSERGIMATLSSRMGSVADNTSGGSYVYRSSKAAVNAVMRSAAIDLRDRGIICVTLHPGWVKTDMGGPNAQITVEDSVAAMRALLDRVTPEDSGKFLDRTGTEIPW